MDGTDDQETRIVFRGFLFFRLALLFPFFFISGSADCGPTLPVTRTGILLLMGLVPLLLYRYAPRWTARREMLAVLAGSDFVLVSILNALYIQQGSAPLFWVFYFLVSAELAWWWGWAGSMIAGVGGGVFLSVLKLADTVDSGQGLTVIAMCFAWPIVVGFFVQWLARQRKERRKMAVWLAEQEDVIRHVQNRFQNWQAACASLQKAESPQALLQTALKEAVNSTSSSVGMIVLNDHPRGTSRAECWSGFALADPSKVTLRIGDRLPALDGGWSIQVRYVQETILRASTRAPDQEAIDLGRIVVARSFGPPYGEIEAQWLQNLAGYTAALLENGLLHSQMGRLQAETDSIGLAAQTLISLPDPAAAMELACRDILETMHLHQVVIFLYGESDEPGIKVIAYPANGETRTMTTPLQGRGLQLLRRFLDIGTPLVANRRSDCPEVFDLMEWGAEVQAAACFPLDALQHRWGALCLLARRTEAFPPQTQQHLSILSGGVAMVLENAHLRQVVDEPSSDLSS